ncbi:MAG: hypothetical protein LBI79_01115 [Nitrososphaerota archaeon]|jgi:hypothetical protein|nr:hypothetical protein [Nitrososphaerota archaeon]
MKNKTKPNTQIGSKNDDQKKWQMNIKKRFTTIVQLFFYVFSSVSSVITVYSFFIGQKTASLILFIITLFVIALLIIVSIKKITSEHEEKIQVIANEFHTYSHSLRDYKYRLDNLVKNKQYNNEALLTMIDSFSENIANHVSRLFSILYARECNTSVKFIKTDFWDNSKINIKKENVELCRVIRCEKSDRRRKDDDLLIHKVKDDTGYSDIFINGTPDYSLLDIAKHEKNNQYKDSKSNRLQYYNNVLIVPIRIKKHILVSTEPRNENNLFGFITLDFLKSGRISENDVKIGLDYLKTFADSSYLLFDEIREKLL